MLKKNTDNIILSFIFLLSCFLFLFNLDNQHLWQDEAQTALISKTILTSKVPLGYDGKNFFSQDFGEEYGKNFIWRWHPWFPFYLLALFFKIFGISTFVARLPFALLGIATIILIFYFAKLLWDDRRIAIISAILLLLSSPFIVHAKQCRYYSPSMFLSLAGLYSYLLVVNNKKCGNVIFLLSLMALFHTQYILCFTLVGTVLTHSLIFHKDRMKIIVTSCLIVILVNLPWLVWVYNVDYTKIYPYIFTPAKFAIFIKSYTTDLAKYIFEPLLLLIPVFVGWYNWKNNKGVFSKNIMMWKNFLLLMLFLIFNIVGFSLFTYSPFFRNIVPLIPILTLITSLIIVSLMNVNLIAGLAIMILSISYSPIYNYIYELTHDYDGPIEGIAKYLNEHGDKDDIVAITYGDMPLKFYTDMKVVGGLAEKDLSSVKDAEWIILRKYTISLKGIHVKNYLRQEITRGNYKKIAIDYPDIPFENMTATGEHRYRTDTEEDRVVIQRRIK